MAASFMNRHIGPTESEIQDMLKSLGFSNMSDLIRNTVPSAIRLNKDLDLPLYGGESEALAKLKSVMSQNKIFKSYIGMGYFNTRTPNVILRNIMENPAWYTQYTPYQAEISQGRLEALINFQTLITDLTGLEISNASLLDEGTAVAEAMHLSFAQKGSAEKNKFFMSELCHPQSIEVVRTRAEPLGIQVVVGNHSTSHWDASYFGGVFQFPATDGTIEDYSHWIQKLQEHDAVATVATDLLALCLLKSPGEMGADIAVGNSQRFGVPLGFGGPHAGFFATREKFKRQIPGRLVGVSVDAEGKPAYRLALQTREQHIRREKATSNICTAQVLLAVMASMYAVYHGPAGLRKIAERTRRRALALATELTHLGFKVENKIVFDTLTLTLDTATAGNLRKISEAQGMNFRYFSPAGSSQRISISVDETTLTEDIENIVQCFAALRNTTAKLVGGGTDSALPENFLRKTTYLSHPVFNSYHSEHEMLRYMYRLQQKDLSLTTSMIPLGSCTMKLNATSEMIPVTWPEVGQIHPFAPAEQTQGYQTLFRDLDKWLSEITGFKAVSLQPNAGSQGEYAGLLVIRQYHIAKGNGHRNVCLIPTSAHGTNPASAVMAGMKVVSVACDTKGNVDLGDLKQKVETHKANLSCIMITYPSTHGVFEETIREICDVIHSAGGQVYLDGANMNAQIGLTRPGDFGADVCHLNLHKTFCIPHGGGGPGMGPIGVAAHLVPYLPGHKVVSLGSERAVGAVSAAPWGSASILPISWMYIAMMGPEGIRKSAEVAILNANYIAKRIAPYFPILYKGSEGLVAHECIADLRAIQDECGITVEDVAKRLIDYGFHAPTISWPVAGTMMIEPTESESKSELDRFCDALISISGEINEVRTGAQPRDRNVLKMAPHTAASIATDTWDRSYSRTTAVFPTHWTKLSKFWPSVARVDNAHGDRNLFCNCPPWEGS